ncbi:hypothetical protein [Acetivibrio ethanolgignens]|uniref:Uncharacterized protein n=1 Tax=Acetivibrio ethanolgignens TaxID=290052 RepID=A0A0V8QHF4_9FIRM|nr:hypothetical protein [Acetivibrio ethanolgignens]KSV59988.1 hypothetical protein ASU35_17630 [Acetivibrio ethanolgignens]
MDDDTPILTKVNDNILLGNKAIALNDPVVQKQLEQMMQQNIIQNVYKPQKTDFIIKNPNEKTDKLLEENNQTAHSIHYESMKTNAQLDTLLKVVDSQNDELERLKSVNQELQKINSVLEDENKHSTRNTVFWSIFTGILLLGIEHFKDIYDFILSLIR